MAIPTFTSATPNTGLAGGRNLITIVGTNFQIPAMLPVAGLAPAAVPTVRVRFGGEDTLRVDVISATQLEVLVPPYRGDPLAAAIAASAIEIANLAANGTVIPGELVTAAGVYTYTRVPLRGPAAEPTLLAVFRELLDVFRRQINPHTSIVTHTDFALAGQAATLLGALPAVALTGLVLEESEAARGVWPDQRRQVIDATSARMFYPGRVHQLEFDVLLVSDNQAELHAMVSGVHDLAQRTPYLYVQQGATRLEYPLERAGPAGYSLAGSPDNLWNATIPFRVLDILLELPEGTALTSTVERAVIQNQQVSGLLVESATES